MGTAFYLAGYFFGTLPFIQSNLKLMIVALFLFQYCQVFSNLFATNASGTRRKIKSNSAVRPLFYPNFGLLCFNVQHSWSVGGKNGICVPKDKTGIEPGSDRKVPNSWIERIKSNITPTRKASIPEGCGLSVIAAVRFYTALSWNES